MPVLRVQVLNDIAVQFLLPSLTIGDSIADEAGLNAEAGVTAELTGLLHGQVEVEGPVVLSSITAGGVGEPPSPRSHWVLSCSLLHRHQGVVGQAEVVELPSPLLGRIEERTCAVASECSVLKDVEKIHVLLLADS